ncbi:hypothetical protein BJ742DRAFT_832444 [Cladochytrium replicatum]|nr:hypothetical protein BJ742DRAFT_832444 [Cladochytrium replicatum]
MMGVELPEVRPKQPDQTDRPISLLTPKTPPHNTNIGTDRLPTSPNIFTDGASGLIQPLKPEGGDPFKPPATGPPSAADDNASSDTTSVSNHYPKPDQPPKKEVPPHTKPRSRSDALLVATGAVCALILFVFSFFGLFWVSSRRRYLLGLTIGFTVGAVIFFALMSLDYGWAVLGGSLGGTELLSAGVCGAILYKTKLGEGQRYLSA